VEESGTVIAALGDSITAGNPGYDPDPAQREALGFGDDERSQYEYWAERESKGGQTPLVFRNCGVFGERTDQIAQRLEDCAEGAEVLIVQGGINDIAQGRSVAEAAADLRSMVVRGKRLGLAVYLVDVLPWNNGHPAADRPISALNRLIAEVGRAEAVPVIGWHDALEDPSRPGLMAPGLTADGDHPSVEAYRALGELVARELGD
jgi:lysophospholipase L1-like esterase